MAEPYDPSAGCPKCGWSHGGPDAACPLPPRPGFPLGTINHPAPHPAEQKLDTLLAGLKAEVERLRRLQKHEEEMQAQWEREAPMQDNQAWSAQNVASASKEAADRLEHLIEQAGGEQ